MLTLADFDTAGTKDTWNLIFLTQVGLPSGILSLRPLHFITKVSTCCRQSCRCALLKNCMDFQSELFRYIMAYSYSKNKFYDEHGCGTGSALQVRLGRCAPLYVVCLLKDRDRLFNSNQQVLAIA